MRDEAEVSVLRRKAGAGKATVELAAMTPAKAMRLAAARAGDEVLHVPVGLREMTDTTVAPEDVEKALPDAALIVQLSGPDGARGLATICPAAVAGMIEALTMGRVLAGTAEPRRPTPTDAVMVADFLDQFLVAAAVLALECPDPPPVNGFLSGPALADARAGVMILQDCAHRQITLELDLGNGAKTGVLLLVVPADRTTAPNRDLDAAVWHATLRNSVLGTSTRLQAVLCKLSLPLSQVRGFAAGDTLTLTQASLDHLTLKGTTGATVSVGKLGRSGSMRAVKLRIKPKLSDPAVQPARVEKRP